MSRPIKIISGTANPKLTDEICKYLGQDAVECDLIQFPDSETFVRINENIRGADVFIVQPTCPPANHNLMELLIIIDAAKRASAKRITAVLPFYGYARQDRKDQPRVPITAKLVANLLVAAGANRILTMDLHAQQIQGFFDIPVDHLYAGPTIFKYLEQNRPENLVVFSPDVGGMKMAVAYANMLNCNVGFVAKRRLSATDVEANSLVGEVENMNILLVDDMTETAGTLIGAAKLLKENGAKSVRAAVTHCVLNDIAFDRLSKNKYLDEIITTDTTPADSRISKFPITVLPIAPVLGEAIKRIAEDESVTSLFEIKGF